jgi:PAS domain S-box-containing protein
MKAPHSFEIAFGRSDVVAENINRGRTTHIEAEKALRESETRFRELADNISQFAWTADRSGWIYWYNKRWYDYTGTTLEQMQGWGWQQVHHPEHVDRVVQRIRQSFETGEPWEDTFPLRCQDGSYRWFLSRALPIRNEFAGLGAILMLQSKSKRKMSYVSSATT